jgi:AcrR family transcriptional regulator
MKRPSPEPDCGLDDGSARARILNAAFEVLHEHGYSATQTREIAARAKVSKRDIYAQFGSKEGIFSALIAARAERMRRPAGKPDVSSREAFAATLREVGLAYQQQLYDPAVISRFRRAIASTEESPEMARILDREAFQPNRRALADMMASAIEAGVIAGEASHLSARFVALLTGGAHVPLLLGIDAPPKPRELARRAEETTAAFLQLHESAQRAGARSSKTTG